MSVKLSMGERLKKIGDEIKALTLCLKDPRLPLPARLAVLAAVGYAFSPIDLIPDFIPLLGQLDDLVIIPLLIALAVKLVPPDLLAECRIRARELTGKADSAAKWGAFFFIISVWVIIFGAVGIWIAKLVGVLN